MSSRSYDYIKQCIEQGVYVDAVDEPILNKSTNTLRSAGWILDFRRVIFRKDILTVVTSLFWEQFSNETIQICGLETAAIPILTALSLQQPEEKAVSTFFMRKSRKKDGLMRMIEGTPESKDVPIVLVDDILNSGKSFIRQVEVLEELGYTIKAVWSIIRFRDEEFYTYFYDKNIEVHNIFTLDDFTESLGLENLHYEPPQPPLMPFEVQWKFVSDNPNYSYVVPKSDPILDTDTVYMGADNGYFWALNQKDGTEKWRYKVGYHAKGKSIFSSPALYENLVIFGAYDGNVYALDKETGKKKWIFWEADHIGSSPAIADDLGLVFVGLEFGLWKKHGGIAALDVNNGKKVWEHSMTAYTHSSPLYIPEKKQVIVGGNEGIVYLFDAKSGKLQWEFKTGNATEEELGIGFSRFDIKESFAYDAQHDVVIFGNNDAKLFALNREDGSLKWCFDEAEFGFIATPVIYGDTVIATSLDKHTYCIDINSGEEKWRWNAGARIFASPVVINNTLYVGANTGRLTELNPQTGEEIAFIAVPERITNKVIYNPETKQYFLPTFANELYCLKRKENEEG